MADAAGGWRLLIQGLVIGLSIAAPVGPIGVLCIRRTLAQGRSYGLLSGLGAATADAVYGCIAAFGLTLVSNVLVRQQTWLRLAGGLFLCYLGARAFLQRYLSSNVPTAGVLYLGVRIEEELGDERARTDYSNQILRQFPESREARSILESG